jgi:hypothetical protein
MVHSTFSVFPSKTLLLLVNLAVRGASVLSRAVVSRQATAPKYLKHVPTIVRLWVNAHLQISIIKVWITVKAQIPFAPQHASAIREDLVLIVDFLRLNLALLGVFGKHCVKACILLSASKMSALPL